MDDDDCSDDEADEMLEKVAIRKHAEINALRSIQRKAAIWQQVVTAAWSVGFVVVVSTIFIVTLKGQVDANKSAIEKMEAARSKSSESLEATLTRMTNEIFELRLAMERKADRR